MASLARAVRIKNAADIDYQRPDTGASLIHERVQAYPRAVESRPPTPFPATPAGGVDFDPSAFLNKVGDAKTTHEYEDKETVFSQGDAADAVYYIQSGKVKLTIVSTRGKEAVVAILDRGHFFGEGALAGQPLRMATANAIQPAVIVRVSKATMVRLLHLEPDFAELFIAHLLSRNVRIEEDLADQLFNSSEKRLARLLLLLARSGQDSKPQSVVPRVSQETLAAMVGTTRSRVSYFMNRFRKLGFIHYDGGPNGGLQVHGALLAATLGD